MSEFVKCYEYERTVQLKGGKLKTYKQIIKRRLKNSPTDIRTNQYKHQMLVSGLAQDLDIDIAEIDFKQDFVNMGWRKSIAGDWEYTLKFAGKALPDDLPDIRTKCYCDTPIHWNHLIQHRKSGKYFIIGSACIKHLGTDMRKMCIDCDQFNSKRTARCGSCRVKCPIHGEYHDDNRNCRSIKVFDSDEESDQIDLVSDIEPIVEHNPMADRISFGKHKGRTYQWIRDNNLQYLKWMARTIEDHVWLADHI